MVIATTKIKMTKTRREVAWQLYQQATGGKGNKGKEQQKIQ